MTPRQRRSGPFASRAALRRALIACFSNQPRRGFVDVTHTAEQLHVTERTVQRWLRGDGRTRAPIGRKSLQQLQFGESIDRRREQQKIEAAREGLRRLAGGRKRDVAKTWRDQGWLDEHRVVILELDRGLRQVVFTNGSTPRARDRDVARYGAATIVTSAVVPNRFSAIVTVAAVLDEVQAWRLYPSAACVPLSRSRCWSASAPAVSLERVIESVTEVDL